MLGLRVSSFKGSAKIAFVLAGWVRQRGSVSVRDTVQLGRCPLDDWKLAKRKAALCHCRDHPIHQQLIHYCSGVVRLVDTSLCEKGIRFVENDDAWRLLCNLLIQVLQRETARKLGALCHNTGH
jgi:hypothetical protein